MVALQLFQMVYSVLRGFESLQDLYALISMLLSLCSYFCCVKYFAVAVEQYKGEFLFGYFHVHAAYGLGPLTPAELDFVGIKFKWFCQVAFNTSLIV